MKISKLDKFKSRKEWSNYAWHELLGDIKNPALAVAMDSLLSSYEKNIIVNRFAAVSLIKEGASYKKIGEELWLSPNTIRSLKIIVEDNLAKEYRSYRTAKNRRKPKTVAVKETKIEESRSFVDWIEYCAAAFPSKHDRRWKVSGRKSL